MISLLLESQPSATHEALSSLLRIPLVTTHIGSSLPSRAKQFAYAVRLGPSPTEITTAALSIIHHYKWTSILVLYDGKLVRIHIRTLCPPLILTILL